MFFALVKFIKQVAIHVIMTEEELETKDEGDKKTEDEIDTSEASIVITDADKKEVLDSFEITQEECDPMTMDCKELQQEAQKLTKKSEALGNVMDVYDEANPLFLKATEEKSKVDEKLTKVFDRAFGTCVTPEKKEEKPEEKPDAEA